MKFKIATWNIGSSSDEGEEKRKRLADVLIEEIKKRDIDILAVQELLWKKDFAQRISQETGLIHYVGKRLSQCRKANDDMGIAIFSKYPIELTSEHRVYNPHMMFSHVYTGETESHAEFTHDKAFICGIVQGMKVATGHGFPYHRYGIDKRVFANSVFAGIDNWVGDELIGPYPACLAGDMNSTDLDEVLPVLTGSFEEAIQSPTRTNSASQHDKQHDYAYIRNAVIKGVENTAIPGFDHNLCVIDIECEESALLGHGPDFMHSYPGAFKPEDIR